MSDWLHGLCWLSSTGCVLTHANNVKSANPPTFVGCVHSNRGMGTAIPLACMVHTPLRPRKSGMAAAVLNPADRAGNFAVKTHGSIDDSQCGPCNQPDTPRECDNPSRVYGQEHIQLMTASMIHVSNLTRQCGPRNQSNPRN